MDDNKKIRRSHENPRIKQIYEEFLGKPLSETANRYLHTSYVERGKFPYLKVKS
ncbi:MAG: iron hydrogenase small subunit [Bacillota bacterium]